MTENVGTCHCGASAPFANHCQEIHRSGAGLGVAAESLMRARYSAYVVGDEGFLLASWHPETRPATVEFDADVTWRGLTVLATEAGTGFDNEGTVEFRARFSRGDQHLELHELSRFERINGDWLYIDGV